MKIPEGQLLVQAGKQLEWMTGGHIKAGFHEVIYSKETEAAREKAKEKGSKLWRISSTMFCQAESSFIMKPHPKFAT